jgi:subtilisin family serine protease
MHRRRLPILLLGLATIAATVTGAPGAAHALPAKTLQQPSGKPPTTVTLITGDRVTVQSNGSLAVTAGPGRAGIRFLSQKIKDHRYVYPADTLALLRSGRVDQRLFDVTALTGFGYTDQSADLPLLVAYPKANKTKGAAALRSATTVGGAKVVRDLSVVNALAVRADRKARASLWNSLTRRTGQERGLAPGVDHIWLDGKRKISLDVSVPQIGAPEAWKVGLDGTGVTVAILDTGIDATHPDLAGQIKGTENFTDTPSTDDTVGHGTHVASIIAGTGAASGGKYRGVAPGAKLLMGKVCGDAFCDESAILAGMAWAAPQAQVINMSLGGGDEPGIDPLEEAVNTLTAQYGALFVIAAGNAGGFAPVSSPATADAALAVGAVDDQDQLADFSSRGPRQGDDAIKPEITAPGVDIIAAKAKNGVIGDPAPVAGYTSLSGTSMATPHVAGSAAILAQQHPAWTAQQKKTALMGSAKPTEGVDVFGQGAGRVDVAREITQSVEVDQGTVSFGRQAWPHGDDTPVTKPVTYRNLGTDPVTLSLALGGTAPAGMFTLGASSLTVPAGGTAATTLTVNTNLDAPDGYFDGYLTATGAGGVRVETPYAVNKEVESYDITLEHVNRDGTPNPDFFTALIDLSTGAQFVAFGDGSTGSTTLRVPKAAYGLFSWLDTGFATDDPADDTITMLVATKLVVDKKSTVPIDARLAKPVSVTVPQAGATPTLIALNADWETDNFGAGASALSGRFEGTYSGQIGSTAPEDSFLGSADVSFARLQNDSFDNSPYTYDLAWFYPGTFPTGLRKSPHGRDLATIRAGYATEAPGAQGYKSNMAQYGAGGGGWSVLLPFDLPFTRTEYVNVDGKAGWSSSFSQILPPADPSSFPEEISGSYEPMTTYQGGRTYSQAWNRAVFGPSVAEASWPFDWVIRTGDTVSVYVPLWSEGSGHAGWSVSDAVHYALYSGDKLVGEFDGEYGEFAVPAGAATYRLEATATRSAPHTLSTQVGGAWTFKSGHVDGETPQRLPLSSVRISPQLDEHNVAPAGQSFDVPLTVEHQTGSAAGRATAVTAEVSYDDGHTWRPARVRGAGDHRVATLRHPAGPGFVSLRVHASDAGGNAVTTTVVRAYAIA